MATTATEYLEWFCSLSFPSGYRHEIYFSTGTRMGLKEAESFIRKMYNDVHINVLYGLR